MHRKFYESSDEELESELARRRRARANGRCDYCDGDATAIPCKHPQRHQLPWAGAGLVLPDVPCTACAPKPDASCATCRGTGKVFDEFAIVFQTNLVAVFGQRTSELSPNLLAKLRELWDAGRKGAERKNPPQFRLRDPDEIQLRIEKPRQGGRADASADVHSSGSFWYDVTDRLPLHQLTMEDIQRTVEKLTKEAPRETDLDPVVDALLWTKRFLDPLPRLVPSKELREWKNVTLDLGPERSDE